EHDEDAPHAERDLGRAAAAGKAHLRRVVVADHGAVQIAVPVDLCRAEEADVDAAALEPVREDLRYRDDGVRRLRQLAVADRERYLGRFRADRPALVDEDAARRARAAREVRREARQADADEADRAVGQAPGRLDGHHLVGGEILHGKPVASHTCATSAARLARYSATSEVPSTCLAVHASKRSRSRLIGSQAT